MIASVDVLLSHIELGFIFSIAAIQKRSGLAVRHIHFFFPPSVNPLLIQLAAGAVRHSTLARAAGVQDSQKNVLAVNGSLFWIQQSGCHCRFSVHHSVRLLVTCIFRENRSLLDPVWHWAAAGCGGVSQSLFVSLSSKHILWTGSENSSKMLACALHASFINLPCHLLLRIRVANCKPKPQPVQRGGIQLQLDGMLQCSRSFACCACDWDHESLL